MSFKNFKRQRLYRLKILSRDVPDIQLAGYPASRISIHFLKSGIRPDTEYALPDIRPDIRYLARLDIQPDNKIFNICRQRKPFSGEIFLMAFSQ